MGSSGNKMKGGVSVGCMPLPPCSQRRVLVGCSSCPGVAGSHWVHFEAPGFIYPGADNQWHFSDVLSLWMGSSPRSHLNFFWAPSKVDHVIWRFIWKSMWIATAIFFQAVIRIRMNEGRRMIRLWAPKVLSMCVNTGGGVHWPSLVLSQSLHTSATPPLTPQPQSSLSSKKEHPEGLCKKELCLKIKSWSSIRLFSFCSHYSNLIP